MRFSRSRRGSLITVWLEVRFGGSNTGRAVSAAGRGRDSADFGTQSLGSPNPFLAPSRLHMKTASVAAQKIRDLMPTLSFRFAPSTTFRSGSVSKFTPRFTAVVTRPDRSEWAPKLPGSSARRDEPAFTISAMIRAVSRWAPTRCARLFHTRRNSAPRNYLSLLRVLSEGGALRMGIRRVAAGSPGSASSTGALWFEKARCPKESPGS
jgi:hypothetical protein